MIESLEKLIEELTHLPTIGRKSAWRLALHLLERPLNEVESLAKAMVVMRRSLVHCKQCFMYSERELCELCSSSLRDQAQICVVEKQVDVFAMEKIGRYKGVYHVLGGSLSPLNGITVDKLSIGALTARIKKDSVRELIVALGGSAEAETTALYLAKIYKNEPIHITRLARGLPAGMELEYVDQITLGQALFERTDIHYGEQ